MGYDRYSLFRNNGKVDIVPFGEIPPKSTDAFEVYRKGKTRLDLLSYEYYKDSSYGWLIMQANPEYGSMEFEIPDGSMIRIPFPLQKTIEDYEESIKRHNNLYD